MAKWHDYHDNADQEALSYMGVEGSADTSAGENSTAKSINLPEGAVNFNMGTIVGSYESVAKMLDEAASVPGVKGIMMTFDDFVIGMDQFGQRIQPLMQSRAEAAASVAA